MSLILAFVCPDPNRPCNRDKSLCGFTAFYGKFLIFEPHK